MLICKIETGVGIQSPADKFFHRLSKELHHAPDASSDNVHGIQVNEGDFKTHGSIKTWSYTIDGVKESFQEKFLIDEETKTVSMIAVDGHVLERYKTYRIDFQVTPKEDGLAVAVVNISITIEKHNAGDADPVKERDFAVAVIKDLDAHLQNNQS